MIINMLSLVNSVIMTLFASIIFISFYQVNISLFSIQLLFILFYRLLLYMVKISMTLRWMKIYQQIVILMLVLTLLMIYQVKTSLNIQNQFFKFFLCSGFLATNKGYIWRWRCFSSIWRDERYDKWWEQDRWWIWI